MRLAPHTYFHLYNRSNNGELLFKTRENYGFFLKKYRQFLDDSLNTLAYCLMPTHFHCLVYVKTTETVELQQKIGRVLSSYTKAMNKYYHRHGSLFQQHSKAKHIDDERYLLQVAIYIHQNPVRAKLVTTQEDWLFSSYQDYIGMRNGTLPDPRLLLSKFPDREAFRQFSEHMLHFIDSKYWV